MIRTDQKLVVDLPKWLVHFSGCPRLESVNPGRIKSWNYIHRGKYVYCPKCQTIGYIFNMDRDSNIAALKKSNIQYMFKGKSLYLQTESSFWKVKYIFPIEKQQLMLYHGNFKPDSVEIQPHKSNCYHRQYDAKECQSIQQILHYIVEHDKFRNNPTSATVKKAPKGNQKLKGRKKRMQNSIKRARVRRTLDTLDSLKKSSQNEQKDG